MEVETTTDNHEHLLNDKENSKIDQLQQFRNGLAAKWAGKTENEGMINPFCNLLNDRADTIRIVKAKKVVNGKKANKLNAMPNIKSDLVNPGPDLVLGTTKKSNTSFNEPQEFAKMDTETTADNSVELLNDKGDTEMVELKPSVNGSAIKSMPLKKQPEIICSCPLQCNKKISYEWRKILYQQFQDIEDHCNQNQFIQRHIKIKSIAKRLWEDEIVDKKTQRRVTCKYLIPMSGTINDSYSYAKTLSYDTVKSSLYSPSDGENPKESLIKSKPAVADDSATKEIQTDFSSTPTNTLPSLNGYHDPVSETRKAETYDVNSPMSLNDSDSVNTSLDDMNGSDGESKLVNSVKYIEVCQKAFMNMFGLTEKRIRWQREKLILKSRIIAEKKQKEREEVDRTLALARSLGAGCQPLFALLEKSNCLHLSKQLMGAIEDDVALVNNFFYNQLWKPEDIMNKSLNISSLELDSLETDCD